MPPLVLIVKGPVKPLLSFVRVKMPAPSLVSCGLLETLYVLGVRANYLETFVKTLRDEGVARRAFLAAARTRAAGGQAGAADARVVGRRQDPHLERVERKHARATAARLDLTLHGVDEVEVEMTSGGEAFFHVSGAGHEGSAILNLSLIPHDYISTIALIRTT